MRKLLFTLVFSLISFAISYAQDTYYGPKAGGNISNFFYSGDDPSFNDLSKMKFSSHIGGFVEFLFDDYLALQPELLFSIKGARFIDEDNDFKSSRVMKYLSVPVVGKYYITKHLDIELGPEFSYLLAAKDVVLDSDLQTNYGDEAASINIIDNLHKFDLGIVGGVGYFLDSGLYFSARYNIGILNTYVTTLEFNDMMRNGTIQFSVGYSVNY